MTGAPTALADLLELGATRSPDGVAVLHGGRAYRYATLMEYRDRIATALSAQGFRAGDHIGICMPSSPDWISTAFAIWAIKGTLIDISPGLPRAARDAVLKNCAAATLVTHDDIRAGALRELPRFEPPGNANTGVPPGTACINLTSGTTGLPRGVILHDLNLLRNAELYIRYVGLTASDCTCLVLPITFGMNKIAMLAHFLAGASVLLAESFVAPNDVLGEMEKAQATGFCAVPSILHTLLARGDLASYPLTSLRYIRVGAGKVDPAMMEQLKRKLPRARICVTYGLTEVGLVSIHTEESFALYPDSCGMVIPEVRVTTIPRDGAHEIIVQCRHAALGYVGSARENEEVFQADGIHTGDLGRLGENGHLYLAGRAKDLIKSGGEGISPSEIEEVLRGFPGIEECAVVPIADPWLGEAIRAYIVPKPSVTLELAALREYCKQHLSPIKRPKEFRTCASLPRNDTGKIDKAALE